MNSPRLDMDELVAEARELLARFEESAAQLRIASDAADGAAGALRAMHTIKGNSRLFGLKVIETTAHAVEEALERIRERPSTAPDAVDSLLAASDFIASLLDDVRRSNEVDAGSILDLLTRSARAESLVVVQREWPLESSTAGPTPLAWIRELSAAGAVQGGRILSAPGGLREPLRGGRLKIEVSLLKDRETADAAGEGKSLQRDAVSNGIESFEIDLSKIQHERKETPLAFIRRLARFATIVGGRLNSSAGDLEDPLGASPLLASIDVATELSLVRLQESLGLVAKSAESVESEPRPAAPAPTPPAPETRAVDLSTTSRELERSTTVRVHTNLLDRLMDLAGELVIVRNQAISSVDVDDGRFRPLFLRLHSVVRDLQEAVMRTRMQPIGALFRRFPRLVRDLARQLGKEIELTLVGEEVELDRSVLEALADPLVHLVRNAVDHGVETPARRSEAGKPPEGRIELSARPESGRIHVEISDDGAGINPEAVRRKAASLGLRSQAELDRMSQSELIELILLPGFSTARAVTDVSGRGVGMDVVKTNLEQLGGRLEIQSTPGKGMRVQLELPLTLAIVPCLLVMSGGRRYAIPQKDVDEVVCLHPELRSGRIERGVDQEVYRLRGKLLPLVRLREVLARPTRFDASVRLEILNQAAADASERGAITFVVSRFGSRRFGLIVDAVLGSEEIVLKPMQAFVKPLACFAGATVLGDGNVVLALDAAGIARHAGLAAAAADASEPPRRRSSQTDTQPFLLFKSGPDEQFAVPLQDVRRLDRIETSKIERINGEEFIVLDGAPVRMMRLEEKLPVSRPTQSSDDFFLILPRRSTTPIGLAATQILDAEQLIPRLENAGKHGPGVLGVAMIHDRLTYVLELNELLGGAATAEGPGGKRVLVVDDSEFFRRLVSAYLRGAGFTVETACDGVEGIEKLRSGRYDLAVSDVEMPNLDGYGFARAARAEPRFAHLPMLALTSLSGDADRGRALASGFSRHEVKLDRDRLLGAVADLLESSKGGAA